MITDKLKELQKLRAKTAELESAVQSEQTKIFATLPQQYGFDNVDAFIKAVKAASGGGKKAAGTKRRKRAVITPEIRAKVSELVKAGKTGADISKTVGISLPSVQNIKKAAGLVEKRRGTKTKAAASEKASAPKK